MSETPASYESAAARLEQITSAGGSEVVLSTAEILHSGLRTVGGARRFAVRAAARPPAGWSAVSAGPPGSAAADTRTTAPASAPSVLRTVDPGELVGSQTTRSGMGVTTSGRVT